MVDSRTPWTVESCRSLHENPWFSVLEQRVIGSDARHHQYFTVDFPRPSVGTIARRNDKYLLIRQYRFIVDEYVWAIPSGGVEEGEAPQDAALRELREETGYSACALEPLLWYYPSYGATNQRFILFLADPVTETREGFDTVETLDIGWFSRQEIIDMIVTNRIVDGLSLTPLATLLLREEMQRPSAV